MSDTRTYIVPDGQENSTKDDEDAGDGTTMRRWYATMVANGMMVDWEDVL